MGGVDVQETSIGHRWQRGPRNAPISNAVFNTAQLGRSCEGPRGAGGRAAGQPIEMGTSEQHAVEQLNAIPGYVEKFQKAFAEQADPITFTNMRDAIALFEATLITPNARLTAICAAMGVRSRRSRKKGCSCSLITAVRLPQRHQHGGDQYQPGVVELPGAEFLPPDDKGRFEVTKSVSDEYVFKVPSLRNIALTPPYFTPAGHGTCGRRWR